MRRFFKFLKYKMPKTFFARALIIIVAPMILTLLLATLIFFDRHWSSMTRRLSYAVASEISIMVYKYEVSNNLDDWEKFRAFSSSKFNMAISVQENVLIPPKQLHPFFWQNPSVILLSQELDEMLGQRFYVDRLSEDGWFLVQVGLSDGNTMVIQVSDKRLSIATTKIFLLWMIGSGALFFLIAAIFMRNQVRPIKRLAIAAEKFGKGQDVERFKPEGASEIRQAATAFLVMRERIKRQIVQRTEMLSGVSHDLRTILTRMKLQCAIINENEDILALKNDIHDMEQMVEGYLAFARGDVSEAVTAKSLNSIIHDSIAPLRRQGTTVVFEPKIDCIVNVRFMAIKRCLSNLLSNAVKYGDKVWISVNSLPIAVEIIIEDDGPGIPKEKYEEVFKPFYRIDESRNSDTGGVGLGLSIARDIAQAHGGNIRLAKSKRGGLKAVIRIPR